MIKAKYEHSKCGTFMFNLCAKWTEFIVKHRWLYYLLACTWGIIMTLIGVLISGVLAITKIFIKEIYFNKYLWIYSISVGPEYWGGFETGLIFVRDHKSTNSLNKHEFGHTFQNTLLGPLFPILVGIPSAIRYWYQAIRTKHGKQNKAYDSIWFEDAASQCGTYAAQVIESKA